jgi:hypothetical protein
MQFGGGYEVQLQFNGRGVGDGRGRLTTLYGRHSVGAPVGQQTSSGTLETYYRTERGSAGSQPSTGDNVDS